MKQYLALLEDVLTNGRVKGDRTGTGTISVFGTQTRYNLENNTLPMVTTKKLFSKGVIEELLWMLRGDTNIKSLNDKDVTLGPSLRRDVAGFSSR
jgi:thymidylate synthase